MRLLIFSLVLTIVLGLGVAPALAQTGTPTPLAGPLAQDEGETGIPLVHVVVEGETLFSIAEQYSTSIDVLQQLNGIDDPSYLYVGQELIVPGGEGELIATVHTVQIGDTLRGLAADYNTTVEAIAAANRLINPNFLVAGQQLSIISRTGTAEPWPVTGTPHLVGPGDTALTVAALYNTTTQAIAGGNDLPYPLRLYPGQRLRLPGENRYQYLTGTLARVKVQPSPAIQGQTVGIFVESLTDQLPAGRFGERPLRFTPYQDGYVALIGLDAFAEPGRYPLELAGQENQLWPPFLQAVEVVSGNYGTQYITVAEELAPLLDPQVRADSEAILGAIYEQVSDTPLWEGLFQVPVSNTVITAGYGDARSYNEGPIEIFHTGVDFAGVVGTPIRAPAAGTVVFSDTLPLQGLTLIIDHGLGVMTGLYHLSAIRVNVGDAVAAGQIIAQGGSTGLSSGPHLHWDLRVANVPVDGLQWTQEDLLGSLAAPP